VIVVARFKPSGLLDSTFGGGNGYVVSPGASGTAYDVAMYGGKIVAARGRFIARYAGS